MKSLGYNIKMESEEPPVEEHPYFTYHYPSLNNPE